MLHECAGFFLEKWNWNQVVNLKQVLWFLTLTSWAELYSAIRWCSLHELGMAGYVIKYYLDDGHSRPPK